MNKSSKRLARLTRAPAGVDREGRILTSLMPDELTECKQESQEQGYTKSAFVRSVYLMGMVTYRRKKAANSGFRL